MKKNDDFDWDKYTEDGYLRQQQEYLRTKENDLFITENGIYYSENGIEFRDNLHPNCKELYHYVNKLQPQSILECGCGACFTLKNLEVITSNTELYGIDISKKQLEVSNLFTQLSGNLLKNVSVMDITKDIPDRKFDFVFTNAVIMHLSTDNAIKALNNIKKISNKYVFLVENINSHDGWYDMVKEVFYDWDMSRTSRFIQYGILLTNNEK